MTIELLLNKIDLNFSPSNLNRDLDKISEIQSKASNTKSSLKIQNEIYNNDSSPSKNDFKRNSNVESLISELRRDRNQSIIYSNEKESDFQTFFEKSFKPRLISISNKSKNHCPVFNTTKIIPIHRESNICVPLRVQTSWTLNYNSLGLSNNLMQKGRNTHHKMHTSFEVNKDALKSKHKPKIKINGVSQEDSVSCLLKEWRKQSNSLKNKQYKVEKWKQQNINNSN